jgi:myo-inositol 2-dehydrogenase / D-chiro-inositol 1-dehydrogenase
MDDVEIVAVADVNAEATTVMAREVGGRQFAQRAGDDPGSHLYADSLCVPPFAHGDLELAAVERGVLIFVE